MKKRLWYALVYVLALWAVLGAFAILMLVAKHIGNGWAALIFLTIAAAWCGWDFAKWESNRYGE